MFVATDTVDHEISCLPVHTVPGTTMAAFVIHFETQLPRSRVQSQLSNPEINQQKTSCTNGNNISRQCMTNNYKNAGSNRTATPGCGCGQGEPNRHHCHRGGNEPAQCHPKRQTRDSAADGNAGAPRLRRNHYESRAEKSTAEGRGENAGRNVSAGRSITFKLRALRRRLSGPASLTDGRECRRLFRLRRRLLLSPSPPIDWTAGWVVRDTIYFYF